MVGVAHAGREGVRLGVVDAALDAMVALGADPSRVRVQLGPRLRCLLRGPGRPAETVSRPPSPAARRPPAWGTPGLDLRAGLVAHLAGPGGRTVAVDSTMHARGRSLFSYRRDGVTGRFAGLVWLAP